MSRRKQDLDELLDYLNIQVDNPVAILDQEEAKKFLTGKASDKHAFFMKATELERIDKVFAAIVDRAIELESTMKRLADSLTAKSELVKSRKKIVDEFQAVEELEKKRLAMEVDYAWAFYAERSGDYEGAVEVIEYFRIWLVCPEPNFQHFSSEFYRRKWKISKRRQQLRSRS